MGVVEPTRYRDLRSARATIYVPARQFIGAAESLAVRSTASASVVAERVRVEAQRLDPSVTVMPAQPFARLLDVPLARPRFSALLIGMFGAVGVLLAVIGLYAAMAASVRQRQREIGVRIALGATAGDVRSLVLSEGLLLIGTGVVVGGLLTAAAARMLRGLLYGVEPLDPAALGLAILVPIAVGLAAVGLPARRASRVDPMAALRND